MLDHSSTQLDNRDMPPVKTVPVATSKSAICRSFCPLYKQRTGQGRINIVTDLGDNSMPDISKQRDSHLLIKSIANEGA